MKMHRVTVALCGLACLLAPCANAAANGEITVWSWFISSTMEKAIKAEWR
jgi:ABC-type glycerol-3-phosphate transport system substrate-binding protein